MIIFIYNQCQKKSTPLPETETDVYHQFTIMSIASKTSITPEELRSVCEESSIASIANLGILVVDASDEEYGASHVLSFVHPTHQEFLAAYYASRLSSDDQLRAIRDHIVQPGMHVVLKFFSGITKFPWTAIMDNLLVAEDGKKRPVNLRALHCVFEAQNFELQNG